MTRLKAHLQHPIPIPAWVLYLVALLILLPDVVSLGVAIAIIGYGMYRMVRVRREARTAQTHGV